MLDTEALEERTKSRQVDEMPISMVVGCTEMFKSLTVSITAHWLGIEGGSDTLDGQGTWK